MANEALIVKFIEKLNKHEDELLSKKTSWGRNDLKFELMKARMAALTELVAETTE